TLINSHLSKRYGAKQSIRWLLMVYAAAGTILLLFTLIKGDPPNFAFCFGAIAVLMGINLAVEPNSSALAMEPMGNTAGIASSVYGTCFFFIGASLGSIISNMMSTSVLPLIISIFIIGIVCLVLVFKE